MHHQGSSTHALFTKLGRLIEFGEVKHQSHKTSEDSNSDIVAVVIEEEIRTKLTSHGTNIWLNVQNNPDIFRDFLSTSSSSSSGSSVPQDEKTNNSDSSVMKIQARELEKERAAASGYIRSLACRLILISKIQTKDLLIPKLIQKNVDEKSSSSIPVPLAMNGELEFAFKCLLRAGRAIMHHSSTLVSMSSISFVYDPSAAYSTLSLALVFWEGVEQVNRVNKDNGKRGMFTDDAFDAMLSLPDCATLLNTNTTRKSDDNANANASDDMKSLPTNDITALVLETLKRLEEFVNSQVSSTENKHNVLRSIQFFLPSLARISYKVRVEDGMNFAQLILGYIYTIYINLINLFFDIFHMPITAW